MSDINRIVEQQINVLRKEYVVKLPSKLAELVENANKLQEDTENGAVLKNFHRLAHSLAGSAAIYGVSDVGDKALELEIFIMPCVKNEADLTLEKTQHIQQIIADLQALIHAILESN